MDIKDFNIFDVASFLMKFIAGGVVAVEHEGSGVQPHAVNIVNGKVVLSTRVTPISESQAVTTETVAS